MNTFVRNILAVIAGFIAGSVANMGLIMIGGSVIAPPAGVDPSNMESIRAAIHLFEPKHFLFPFLAHAVGAFAGGLVASVISANRAMLLAMITGGLFLLGGLATAFLIPAPAWFIVLDLVLAYIPMALLGWKLAGED